MYSYTYFSHIIPILKSLQWLPVIYLTNFKICDLTHSKLETSCGGRLSAYLLSLHKRGDVADSWSALTSHKLKYKSACKNSAFIIIIIHFHWVNLITSDLSSPIDLILTLRVPYHLTPLLYSVSKKSTMAFALFLTPHFIFGIIYLTLFVLLLHTCPLEKT